MNYIICELVNGVLVPRLLERGDLEILSQTAAEMLLLKLREEEPIAVWIALAVL